MSGSTRRAVVVALALVALSLVAIGAASAKSGHRARRVELRRTTVSHRYVRPRDRGLTAKRVLAGSKQVRTRVIVVLRNQLKSLPATHAHVRARISAEATGDAAIENDVSRSGGFVYKRYHALNAFAADVSAAERSALLGSAQVQAVVPDTIVKLPVPDTSPVSTGIKGQTATPSGSQQVCPADPSQPLLEPEALQTTHTAYADPSTPQAQNLATGAGVKVAFFADGLDVNNPDLIRPDGSRVITDYKDFSGEGTGAPSNSLEAFGDASSIAAQGKATYDISQFVNPAHPLPPGCTIKVRGVAPGASLIAIKVFGNTDSAFNSVILQGLDYALYQDHPNVISESFGGYPIPDTTQDLTRLFNEQAVADGVTVVESSGDAGVQASPSSASSDPSVIAAGASTTFQNYAQGTQYGYQFTKNMTGGWESDNISSIESAGITQGGRALDLVAPGEANWALCSTDTTMYTGCVNYANQPTNLESFGGTSESAPLIAGGAALVIQAYRQTHDGATPSPALVRRLLTSTATDLHAPSFEQGAGELNTLAAVQAAEALGHSGQATGHNLLVGPTQLDLSGDAGSPFQRDVEVTNVGSTPQTVSGAVRQLGAATDTQNGAVTLDSTSLTFVDQFGNTVPYEQIHFQVPANTDRLDTTLAWTDPSSRVGLTLIDPSGKMAAFTRPQGGGDHGEVDVAEPQAGTWTGIIFRRDGTFQGPVQWQATAQNLTAADTVSPQSMTLAPGQSATFQVSSSFPSTGGDTSQDLVFSSDAGTTSVVPIVLRSLVPTTSAGGQFSGTLFGGNGRAGSPAQLNTYDFQVPPGQPELTVSLAFGTIPAGGVSGVLISPTGQEVTEGNNLFFSGAAEYAGGGLEAFTLNPQPGRWRFVLNTNNPVGGDVLSIPYTGQIGFAPPPVTATGLPDSSQTQLTPGQATNVTVQVTNNGPGFQNVFLDPRTDEREILSLLAFSNAPARNVTLPIAGVNPPIFLMPTETDGVAAFGESTEPMTFDWGWAGGDPDLSAIRSGHVAAGYFSGTATPGEWDIAPDELGPFSGPAPAATANFGLVARTRGFDSTVTTSTGDIEAQAVDPNAGAASPVLLAPGQSGTMTATITPSGHPGDVVRGTLYVDEFDTVGTVAGELVPLPYEYRIADRHHGHGHGHGHGRGRGHDRGHDRGGHHRGR
ncbi:MAG TPA: S8 family serine peptidase [Solirubrobacteraceae bacterium]